MTKQEMLDKAVKGLRSQNWEKCVDLYGNCAYADGRGHHCAWGWVDEDSWGKSSSTNVQGLDTRLATEVRSDELLSIFTMRLQRAHDASLGDMESNFRALAAKYKLTWPED